DFEYAHDTLFLFKEGFRSLLNTAWASDLSLRQLCPFLGEFPEPAARLLSLAWEGHLYSLVLDRYAEQQARQSLRYRFWETFDAHLAHCAEERLAAVRRDLEASAAQVRALQDTIDAEAAGAAERDRQLGQSEEEKRRLIEDRDRLQLLNREESAHAK